MTHTPLAESYGTLSETINALVLLGYTHDFNVHQDSLFCHQSNSVLQPADFQIDKVYRFEGASNPDDQAILYAISASKSDFKGTLVNGYGLSSDAYTNELIEMLQTQDVTVLLADAPSSSANEILAGQEPAGVLRLDLGEAIEQLKSDALWTKGNINTATLYKSDSLRIVLMGMQAHAQLKAHKSDGVISVQLLKGKINFITGEKQAFLESGQMIVLGPEILHSVIALTECFFLLSMATNPSIARLN
ncbi:MAG: cupin domain-containing protein [Sphingobacteriaceae bacterium]|nr:cupin domain-containing protein [Sphingobacteriaceae bacterium]